MSAPTVDVTALVSALGAELVALPGSPEYAQRTRPHNTSVGQAPAAVIRPCDVADVAAAVTSIARCGGVIAIQATGHGAARSLGPESVLVDTGALDAIAIDAAAQTATTGPGATWAQVQAAAAPHGLLGLSGTAPTVAVAGYTFAGGVGWLARPHGLAAARLIAVDYVDGDGTPRRAAEDDDADALWAFRGGAPVGLATQLTFGLVRPSDLAAGYLLWPGDRAEELIDAWVRALDAVTDTVTSTMSLLALPPEGPFPQPLLGRPVVHLSYASPAGVADLAPLRNALAAIVEPAVDTTGPCDAERLATIHLDLPPVPARGAGRWLSSVSPELAVRILRSARVGEDGGLNMVELRHVASGAPAPAGALTTPPGPFLLHAVGGGSDRAARERTDRAARAVLRTAAPADLGRPASAFCDGVQATPGAYEAADTRRLVALTRERDPHRRLRFERAPAGLRAVRFDRFGEVDVLHVVEADLPRPAPGEALVQIRAAGIGPGESAIRRGQLPGSSDADLPSGEGSDLAGVVLAVGDDAGGLTPGDEVLGYSWTRSSHASHAVVPVTQLIHKPAALSWEVAGALYGVAATAWAVVAAVAVSEQDTVAVSAAAGGVGRVVVQLLRTRGARVVGIASSAGGEWLRAHGATPVVYGDGLRQRVQAAAPDGVDAFLDLHGPEYLELAMELGVAPERTNTIISFAKAAETGAQTKGSVDGSSHEVLTEMARLVADGTITIDVVATYPLERVADAFIELERGHTHGKIVLVP